MKNLKCVHNIKSHQNYIYIQAISNFIEELILQINIIL